STRLLMLDTEFLTATVTLHGFAAAMLGGMISLPLTIFGGIAIGVIQAIVESFTPKLSWFSYIYHVIPFSVILLFLLFRRISVSGLTDINLPVLNSGGILRSEE